MRSPVERVLEGRIADTAMTLSRGDLDSVLAWLRRLDCTVVHVEGATDGAPFGRAATVDGLTGVRVGLTRTDPISCAVQLGFALAGACWPQVYPVLLPATEERWRRVKHTVARKPSSAPGLPGLLEAHAFVLPDPLCWARPEGALPRLPAMTAGLSLLHPSVHALPAVGRPAREVR